MKVKKRAFFASKALKIVCRSQFLALQRASQTILVIFRFAAAMRSFYAIRNSEESEPPALCVFSHFYHSA